MYIQHESLTKPYVREHFLASLDFWTGIINSTWPLSPPHKQMIQSAGSSTWLYPVHHSKLLHGKTAPLHSAKEEPEFCFHSTGMLDFENAHTGSFCSSTHRPHRRYSSVLRLPTHWRLDQGGSISTVASGLLWHCRALCPLALPGWELYIIVRGQCTYSPGSSRQPGGGRWCFY